MYLFNVITSGAGILSDTGECEAHPFDRYRRDAKLGWNGHGGTCGLESHDGVESGRKLFVPPHFCGNVRRGSRR